MRCTTVLTIIAVFFIVVTLPVSLVFVVKVLIITVTISLPILMLMLMLTVQVAQEFERAVIYRMGRLLAGGARGPGVFFVVPCVDRFEIVDMRIQTFDIPPQEVASLLANRWRGYKCMPSLQVLTKDSVTIYVNAIMYYKVR